MSSVEQAARAADQRAADAVDPNLDPDVEWYIERIVKYYPPSSGSKGRYLVTWWGKDPATGRPWPPSIVRFQDFTDTAKVLSWHAKHSLPRSASAYKSRGITGPVTPEMVATWSSKRKRKSKAVQRSPRKQQRLVEADEDDDDSELERDEESGDEEDEEPWLEQLRRAPSLEAAVRGVLRQRPGKLKRLLQVVEQVVRAEHAQALPVLQEAMRESVYGVRLDEDSQRCWVSCADDVVALGATHSEREMLRQLHAGTVVAAHASDSNNLGDSRVSTDTFDVIMGSKTIKIFFRNVDERWGSGTGVQVSIDDERVLGVDHGDDNTSNCALPPNWVALNTAAGALGLASSALLVKILNVMVSALCVNGQCYRLLEDGGN